MPSIVIEIECEVEGVINPPEPDVGIFGNSIDDLWLSDVSLLKYKHPKKWEKFDILKGLDDKSKSIVIENILNVYADEAAEELINDQP